MTTENQKVIELHDQITWINFGEVDPRAEAILADGELFISEVTVIALLTGIPVEQSDLDAFDSVVDIATLTQAGYIDEALAIVDSKIDQIPL